MTPEQKERLAKMRNNQRDEAAMDVVFGMEIALNVLGLWEPVLARAKELRVEEGMNPWD